ncbi:MAG: hypothetical protein PWP08_1728 [Methanofollis sp.]|nr:hypothetical protein [Methanofollis sp.]
MNIPPSGRVPFGRCVLEGRRSPGLEDHACRLCDLPHGDQGRAGKSPAKETNSDLPVTFSISLINERGVFAILAAKWYGMT